MKFSLAYATVSAFVSASLLLAGPALAAPTDAEKCEAAKLKEAGKYGFCRLKADSKGVKKSLPPDYSKCEEKFPLKWGKAEDKFLAECPTLGDEASINGRIQTDANEIATLLSDGAVSECGNGVVEAGEDCDFGDLNGATCASLGLSGEGLECGAGCVHNTGACTVFLEFESTVSGVFGSLPAGVAIDDTVTFALNIQMNSATSTFPNGFNCGGFGIIDCYESAWTFPPAQYTLTYSSGYSQTGQIDHMEMFDGGLEDFGGGFFFPASDGIRFYDGSDQVYYVQSNDGSAYTGAFPGDLDSATSNIDQPALFSLTQYFAFATNSWFTYHYDYAKPQQNTIVTRSP